MVRSHARVSSLSLKNVQFTYAGQYLCTASNSIGQDDQPLYLEVRCKSRERRRKSLCECKNDFL